MNMLSGIVGEQMEHCVIIFEMSLTRTLFLSVDIYGMKVYSGTSLLGPYLGP